MYPLGPGTFDFEAYEKAAKEYADSRQDRLRFVSGEVDFSDWGMEDATIQEWAEVINEAIQGEDEPAYIFFPYWYGNSDGIGGPAVDNPLAIYVRLPLSAGGGIVLRVDFDKAMLDNYGGDEEYVGYGPDSVKSATETATALRALADRLDKQAKLIAEACKERDNDNPDEVTT